ncbi:MAG: hypothetical protein EZS28_037074 [Streblomastix strix]|uniref:HNH nuclease domain-containing protein n=1 Tax=Streblomastix strix TaxID=222440 RepID=A0A5J4UAB9_9EUKA|nr:MAG: hypothetical protein EZS28_037074 [Streblomastix strix]
MENNNQQQFVQLVVEPEFEITTTQPWRIRRIADGFEPTINQRTDGYMQVGLNNRTYSIHRLVALQFIPNDDPENKIQVDHRSQIKTDNSLGNLCWVTVSQNNLNKGQIHRNIANYVYHDDIDDETGYHFVYAVDTNGQRHKIQYVKFKRFVGLI